MRVRLTLRAIAKASGVSLRDEFSGAGTAGVTRWGTGKTPVRLYMGRMPMPHG